MSTKDPAALQTAATDDCTDPVDALDFDPQTGKRAVYEAFDFERAGDVVRVWNESHGEPDEHVHTVELDGRGVPVRCTCPDYEYRRGPDGEMCKHGVGVALHAERIPDLATDGGETVGEAETAYSYHTEPAEQGGARFVQCEHCGAECVPADPDRLAHREGCPLGGRQ